MKCISLPGVLLHDFEGEKIAPAIRIKPKIKENSIFILALLFIMCGFLKVGDFDPGVHFLFLLD
jgi:hypothetical protein